jgi:hypothetical protein
LAKHPALARAWCKGLGLGLMFDDSRVLLAALNALMAQGVPALPIHDALLVQASKRDAAQHAMEQAAREVAGVDMPVSCMDEGASASKGRGEAEGRRPSNVLQEPPCHRLQAFAAC